MTPTPPVSLVFSTNGRVPKVRVWPALERLAQGSLEIAVVDKSKCNQVSKWIAHKNLPYIGIGVEPGIGRGEVLSLGLDSTNGDFVVFVDDDSGVLATENFPQSYALTLQGKPEACVCAHLFNPVPNDWGLDPKYRMQALAHFYGVADGTLYVGDPTCYAVRRSAVVDIGESPLVFGRDRHREWMRLHRWTTKNNWVMAGVS